MMLSNIARVLNQWIINEGNGKMRPLFDSRTQVVHLILAGIVLGLATVLIIPGKGTTVADQAPVSTSNPTQAPSPEPPQGNGQHVAATGNPLLDQYRQQNGYIVDTSNPPCENGARALNSDGVPCAPTPTPQVVYVPQPAAPLPTHCTTTTYGINNQFASTDCH